MRRWWAAGLALALLAGIVAYQVFAPRRVGLADSGDFQRLLTRYGVHKLETDPARLHFTYVNRWYAITDDPAARYYNGFVTSEAMFVRALLAAHRVLAPGRPVDLLWMGAIHSAAYLAAFAVLLVALARWLERPLAVLGAGALLALVFGDVAYVAYFNSFYSEPAALIFGVAVVGTALWFLITRRMVWLGLFYVAVTGFLLSKQQHVPAGILLAGYGALAGWRLGRGRWARAAAIGGALGVLAIGLAYLAWGSPGQYRRMNLYQSVFMGILNPSPNPAEDLRALGADPALASLAGVNYFLVDPAVTEGAAMDAAFFRRVSVADVARFYLRRPGRFWDQVQQAAPRLWEMRFPNYLGNFEPAAGLPPYAQSERFDVWSDAKAARLPDEAWFAALVLAGLLALGAVRWARYPAGRWASGLFLLLPVIAGVELGVALAAEGQADLVKHLAGFHLALDGALVWVGCALLGWAVQRTSRQGEKRSTP